MEPQINKEELEESSHDLLKKVFLDQEILIGSLPVGVYTCNARGEIIQFNKRAEEIWGRQPAPNDLYCGSYKRFLPTGKELASGETPPANSLMDGRRYRDILLTFESPDNNRVEVIFSTVPVRNRDGILIGLVNCFYEEKNREANNGSTTAITEWKKADMVSRESVKLRRPGKKFPGEEQEKNCDLDTMMKELAKSKEQYHKMIGEVEDYAIILLDPDGTIMNWNRGAETIKGYKEEEIVGKNFELFYLEEDREKGIAKNLLNIAATNGKALYEGWRRRKDGTSFWGSIVLTALHDEQNNIIGYSKVTRDLSERKFAEDKLKEYAHELEFQNKELEQFAYAASHDMKEPLRKINFYNCYIAERAGNLLDEKSREYLNRSINAAKRMNELIEDLLTYSRTTNNSDFYEKVDINEVVEEIVWNHKDEFVQHDIRFTYDQLPVIPAIPFQVKQLLENLVNNAIKYRRPEKNSFIKVSYGLADGSEIEDSDADSLKQYHRISISDNGIGFENQYEGKIFEIFQRLKTKPGTKGSGIGLAICKKIMQNHKGFICAKGAVNDGATFTVYFPELSR